jgi:hypothetical protein
MRKIYLVKKNPELPADGNNWIVMNSFEFMNFVKTPDGQKRKACFGQLDACSVDDVIIVELKPQNSGVLKRIGMIILRQSKNSPGL